MCLFCHAYTRSLHGRDASSDGLHGSMHASSSHGNPLHHGESGASGSRFLLGGVPRLYPESALAEKDKAALLAAQVLVGVGVGVTVESNPNSNDVQRKEPQYPFLNSDRFLAFFSFP